MSVSSHFYKTPFGSRPEGLGEPPCRYRGETFPGDQRPRQGPPGLLKRGHRAGSAASRGHSGDQRGTAGGGLCSAPQATGKLSLKESELLQGLEYTGGRLLLSFIVLINFIVYI